MEKTWSIIQSIYLPNQLSWNIALGVAVILAWVYFQREKKETTEEENLWLSFLPRGRGKMLRRARRLFIRQQASYDFVHSVEERVYNGEYSREEARELYREAKKVWPIRDMFPSPELLKEALRKRKELHIHDPVPLPDMKAKPKHAFDRPVKV